MTILIIGASRGLGRALADGLTTAGHDVVGVARTIPDGRPGWIAADLSRPAEAARGIAAAIPASLDTVIWNVGIWEQAAFSEAYAFAGGAARAGADADAEIEALIQTNVTAAILVLRRLLPGLLTHTQPRVIITGSTSGLRGSGRLAVTTLQLGYLNTDDGLDVPVADAAERGAGQLVPVHDVVRIVQTLLELSPAAFVRDLTLPAILDDRF